MTNDLGISGRKTSLTIKTIYGEFASNLTALQGLEVASISEDNNEDKITMKITHWSHEQSQIAVNQADIKSKLAGTFFKLRRRWKRMTYQMCYKKCIITNSQNANI